MNQTKKYIKMGIISIITIILTMSVTSCDLLNLSDNNNIGDDGTRAHSNAGWTVMVYSDGDNNLESALLEDVYEMKSGFVNSDNLYLIVLVDRIDGQSTDASVYGEDFTDTRLYRITNNTATRIGGGSYMPDITNSSNYEANMGDPNTLKKFIDYCKAIYPATHYALILSNHGGGPRSNNSGSSDATLVKAFCSDDTNNGDMLYTAEVTDVLTSSESVDLLGFDECLMGSIEVAYQYRPNNGAFAADIMIASSPEEWGAGWQYDKIFERITNTAGNNGETAQITGGSESYYDPSTMTASEFAGLIVEEQRDSAVVGSSTDQSLSSYDLSKVETVKNNVDNLSKQLDLESKQAKFETVRDKSIAYFDKTTSTNWVSTPFFDLYDICNFITGDNSADFSPTIISYAESVKSSVNNFITYSYGGSKYSGFTNGKNGVSIFFSDGDSRHYDGIHFDWQYQWWYNAIDTNTWWTGGHYYGKLSWCIDGATASNGAVGNWFEMLDKWFDNILLNSGEGYNGYKY